MMTRISRNDMKIELRISNSTGKELSVLCEEAAEKINDREYREPLNIGAFCAGCSNPEERVMQSFVYDPENIIRLGRHERARIAAEVIAERGDDPVEAAQNRILPAVREAVNGFENNRIKKTDLIKSLQAADIMMDVLENSSEEGWNESECGAWREYLNETLVKTCGLVLP